MYDVVAMGELLIDFTEAGRSESGQRLFEQNPGGATPNVLSACAKLGLSTAFTGKVGNDMHGRYLRQVLVEAGINADGLVLTDEAFTTLAFVALENGERHFSFARKPGADTLLRADEMDAAVLGDTRVFHLGSLSLTDEPARTATFAAIEKAKAAGAFISYDPNYRASLWPGEEAAMAMMRRPLESADLVKISDEETQLLCGCQAPKDAAARLLAGGAKLAVVTLGRQGVLAATRKGAVQVAAYPVPVQDTTGAGDAFWGGFLYALLTGTAPPETLGAEALARYACFACAVAGFCVGRRGGIPAMPTLAQAEALMAAYPQPEVQYLTV